MPVIVGAPRSGTTLLRLMLDAHPALAIPPETGFLTIARALQETPGLDADAFCDAVTAYPPDAPAWPDFGLDADDFRTRLRALEPFTAAAGFRLFYRLYAERFGKPRWGDKTPGYCLQLTNIAAVLPEARFVHVIRDGRDVAVSLRRRWFSPGHAIDIQARFWHEHVTAGREQGRVCPHYLEVRYEDLVREPEATLRRVCGFLNLEYLPALLDYHERAPERLAEHLARHGVDGRLVVSQAERFEQQVKTTRPPDPQQIGRWRQALTPADATAFEAIAGDLLREYGYLDTEPPRPRRRWRWPGRPRQHEPGAHR